MVRAAGGVVARNKANLKGGVQHSLRTEFFRAAAAQFLFFARPLKKSLPRCTEFRYMALMARTIS